MQRRFEPEHCSDIRNAYRVKKAQSILHFSTRGDPQLYFLQAHFSLSALTWFAYAVKRLETQRQNLTFEVCAASHSVFARSLPTSLQLSVWEVKPGQTLSAFPDSPCKGGTKVHFCDIFKLIPPGACKDSRILVWETLLINLILDISCYYSKYTVNTINVNISI